MALLKALSTNSFGTLNLPANANAKPVPTANFLGVTIVGQALTHPARMIINNAGEEAPVIVGTLLSKEGSPDKFAWA